MSSKVVMDNYMRFIATSRYARWLEEQGRREAWKETVERYIDNVVVTGLSKSDAMLGEEMVDVAEDLEKAIRDLDVMPSMRAVMTAGPALERDNTCAYNCAYTSVDSPRAFDEAMFILLCGTGVGFSVERQSINQLPVVPEVFDISRPVVAVEDSKEGWAKSLREVVDHLYNGRLPLIDTSQVRPAGARLKTFGGRASGPAPLNDLVNFFVTTFLNARGRRLSSIECHDLMCKIGEVVVVGGVRRSAMISLSNLSDERLRQAKSGQWWEHNPHRALANNSVSYTEKPDIGIFMKEWLALYESKSGERGIFNREASVKQVSKNKRRDPNWEFGTNPCSEIILRPKQFC